MTLAPAATAVAPASASHATTSTGMTQRIEKIRALLEKGEYPVDLDLLASRIVDDDVVRTSRRPS